MISPRPRQRVPRCVVSVLRYGLPSESKTWAAPNSPMHELRHISTEDTGPPTTLPLLKKTRKVWLNQKHTTEKMTRGSKHAHLDARGVLNGPAGGGLGEAVALHKRHVERNAHKALDVGADGPAARNCQLEAPAQDLARLGQQRRAERRRPPVHERRIAPRKRSRKKGAGRPVRLT